MLFGGKQSPKSTLALGESRGALLFLSKIDDELTQLWLCLPYVLYVRICTEIDTQSPD